MTATPYDVYNDMLETHAEIGYLVVLLIGVAVYSTALAVVLIEWPGEDVYLVPGVEVCGLAGLQWAGQQPQHGHDTRTPPIRR
jgi:hypothetical protein